MPDRSQEREFREEAARLAQLPRADQRAIVALHRSVADNPKVPKQDRDAARDLANALEKLLCLTPKKKPK